ncbi:hypothetical protein TUM17556_49210 [Enterobacter asburiae]|uniref:hypothetical protein n=1 Tax=Enterobacter hormaechei TaxID=158836 RepID=UPI002084B9B1|nr:hypothetical protein [Enterobacter hormaechei]GJK33002.1 hypothetical protein TUM17556_49210 [Enterobacter asburiae]
MFGFSSGALMTFNDDERHLLVSVVSGWLRRAEGDAGASPKQRTQAGVAHHH